MLNAVRRPRRRIRRHTLSAKRGMLNAVHRPRRTIRRHTEMKVVEAFKIRSMLNAFRRPRRTVCRCTEMKVVETFGNSQRRSRMGGMNADGRVGETLEMSFGGGPFRARHCVVLIRRADVASMTMGTRLPSMVLCPSAPRWTIEHDAHFVRGR